MANDPTSLLGLFEGGIKKVAPTLITGLVLVVVVLYLWPDETMPLLPENSGIALQVLVHLPDGGRQGLDVVDTTIGAPLQLCANVPFAATVAVFKVISDGGAVRIWPLDGGEPERCSAGKMVELPGAVLVTEPPGEQAWVVSMCQLGSEAPACIVKSAKAAVCPEGCVTAKLTARVGRGP